jgi:hypothetical protein
VGVPKAAINKNDLFARCEYDVGIPRQIATIQAKPVAEGMKEAADGQLWCRIFPSDPGHQSASAGLGSVVYHGSTVRFHRGSDHER